MVDVKGWCCKTSVVVMEVVCSGELYLVVEDLGEELYNVKNQVVGGPAGRKLGCGVFQGCGVDFRL